MLLRSSKNEADLAFDQYANERKVWCNDLEITDWATADEFRRVVIDVKGRVYNGSVRIERLPSDSMQEVRAMSEEAKICDESIMESANSEPITVEISVTQVNLEFEVVGRTLPEIPDVVTIDAQSEWLPDSESQP